jgi:hypothetical protein
VDRNVSRDLQYLALPTAVSELHMHMFGAPPEVVVPHLMQFTLNELAGSLAALAPIYTLDSGAPKELPRDELASGAFSGGAHLFVTQTGKQYRKLVVQRGQIDAAALIMQKRALQRALEVLGSPAALAAALEVDTEQLEAYLATVSLLPPKVFIAVLDLSAGLRLPGDK